MNGLKKTILAATAVFVLGLGGNAHAMPMISFDEGGIVQTGTVSYDGSTTLDGINIVFTSITGSGTAANDGVSLDCENCVLNFSTGNVIVDPGTTGAYLFSAGGSFTLTGTATDPNNGGAVVAAGTLLQGTFGSNPSDPLFLASAVSFSSFTSFGTDEKHPDLVAFYGETQDGWTFANTEITTEITNFNPDGSFTALVTNADIDNQKFPPQVPEPGTVILFGTGLAGLALWRKRQTQA